MERKAPKGTWIHGGDVWPADETVFTIVGPCGRSPKAGGPQDCEPPLSFSDGDRQKGKQCSWVTAQTLLILPL